MVGFETWPVILKLSFLIFPFAVALLGASISLHITLTRDFHVVYSAITSNLYIEQLKFVGGHRV